MQGRELLELLLAVSGASAADVLAASRRRTGLHDGSGYVY